ESPMPAAAADRELLLRRVMKDFPGTAPTAEEIAAFVAHDAKEPLPRLIKSLQTRCGPMHFAGELSGGETKFRLTAAAPKKDQAEGGRERQARHRAEAEMGRACEWVADGAGLAAFARRTRDGRREAFLPRRAECFASPGPAHRERCRPESAPGDNVGQREA